MVLSPPHHHHHTPSPPSHLKPQHPTIISTPITASLNPSTSNFSLISIASSSTSQFLDSTPFSALYFYLYDFHITYITSNTVLLTASSLHLPSLVLTPNSESPTHKLASCPSYLDLHHFLAAIQTSHPPARLTCLFSVPHPPPPPHANPQPTSQQPHYRTTTTGTTIHRHNDNFTTTAVRSRAERRW